jgi:hypothetical protein
MSAGSRRCLTLAEMFAELGGGDAIHTFQQGWTRDDFDASGRRESPTAPRDPIPRAAAPYATPIAVRGMLIIRTGRGPRPPKLTGVQLHSEASFFDHIFGSAERWYDVQVTAPGENPEQRNNPPHQPPVVTDTPPPRFDRVKAADALCRPATGSGFATRMLHTDRDEMIFEGARPIIINGIPTLTDRSDLADRAVTIHLRALPENERHPEDELLADFERARPHILGALMDATSRHSATSPASSSIGHRAWPTS